MTRNESQADLIYLRDCFIFIMMEKDIETNLDFNFKNN